MGASVGIALASTSEHSPEDLLVAVIDALPRGTPRILDLGAGTGSNQRFISTMVSGRTAPGSAPALQPAWLLVDHDPALLAQVPTASGIETRCMDLASLDDRAIFDQRSLVTASALLDLVSEDWLRLLAARCSEARASVLFALSYDGRVSCSPADPDDPWMIDLVNQHQRIDKGFGPALGPQASACAQRVFAEHGYRVQCAPSDWAIPTASQELQRQLVEGWADAALQIAPSSASAIAAWRLRRLAHVAAGRSEIVVGHEDLAGMFEG